MFNLKLRFKNVQEGINIFVTYGTSFEGEQKLLVKGQDGIYQVQSKFGLDTVFVTVVPLENKL